jgi:hypothetical protein
LTIDNREDLVKGGGCFNGAWKIEMLRRPMIDSVAGLLARTVYDDRWRALPSSDPLTRCNNGLIWQGGDDKITLLALSGRSTGRQFFVLLKAAAMGWMMDSMKYFAIVD